MEIDENSNWLLDYGLMDDISTVVDYVAPPAVVVGFSWPSDIPAVRSLPLHYPSWHDLDAATRAAFMNRLGEFFDLESHKLKPEWEFIRSSMNQYIAKRYSDNKGSMKKAYFTLKGGPAAVDVVRQNPPPNVEPSVWEEHLKFYMNDKTLKRAAVNKENRKKNKVYSRHDSKSLAAIRHDYRMNSKDKQYPSLIQSFYDTHCEKDGIWLQDEARVQYEEMVWLRDLGANTPEGVAYTEEQILAMVLKGTQRGHIAGRGRVVAGLRRPPLPCTPPPPPGMAEMSAELAAAQKKIAEAEKKSQENAKERKTMKKTLDLLMGFASSNPQWSQYISQVDSQHVDGSGSGASGSGSGAGGSGSDDIEDLDGDDDHDDHDE